MTKEVNNEVENNEEPETSSEESVDHIKLGYEQASKEFKKNLSKLFGSTNLSKIAEEYSELKNNPSRNETIGMAKELAAKEKQLEELQQAFEQTHTQLMDYKIKMPINEAINKVGPKRPEYAKILLNEVLPRIKLAEDNQTLIVLDKSGSPTDGKEIMTLDDLINEIAIEMPELVNAGNKSGHGSRLPLQQNQYVDYKTNINASSENDIEKHNKAVEARDHQIRLALQGILAK